MCGHCMGDLRDFAPVSVIPIIDGMAVLAGRVTKARVTDDDADDYGDEDFRSVAQLARASVSKTEGWGFETLHSCHEGWACHEGWVGMLALAMGSWIEGRA